MSELEAPLAHLAELIRDEPKSGPRPQAMTWRREQKLIQLAFTWPSLACRLGDLLEAMGEPIPRPLQRARAAERENKPW